MGSPIGRASDYVDEEQKRVAEDTIADVDASGLWDGKVVTDVEPVGEFWGGRAGSPELSGRIGRAAIRATFVRSGWVLPECSKRWTTCTASGRGRGGIVFASRGHCADPGPPSQLHDRVVLRRGYRTLLLVRVEISSPPPSQHQDRRIMSRSLVLSDHAALAGILIPIACNSTHSLRPMALKVSIMLARRLAWRTSPT